MKSRMWHSVSVAFLLAFGPLSVSSCSSSQQQATDESLESEEGSQEAGNQEAGNENAEASEQGADGNITNGGEEGGEGNAAAEGEEGADAAAEGGDAAAAEGEASEEVVSEEQLVNDEGVTQAEQQGDLQEIIEEMNQGEGNAAAAAEGGDAAAPTESVMAENNASDTSEPVGAAVADAAAAPGVENIASAPAADAAVPAPAAHEAVPAAMAPAPEAHAATPGAGAVGLPEMGSKMSYIVQKGDTLAKIATKIYGDASKWQEMASFTGLANPKLIYPGDVIYYQLTESSQAFAQTYESLPRAEVQVQQGDTLSTIAARVLGSSESWKLIWRQNDNISDPDKLTAGTTIFYIEPSALGAAIANMTEKFAEAKATVVRVVVENFANSHSTQTHNNNFDADLNIEADIFGNTVDAAYVSQAI